MRVLLDESVPRSLRRELPGHTLMGVSQMGWSGCTDAELVRRSAAHFDFLITVERRTQWSADHPLLAPAILVLQSTCGTVEALAPLMATARTLIEQVPHIRYAILQSGGFTLPRKLATSSSA